MTRKEAMRQTMQADTLRSLGFTQAEAESLRRISMTLQRWHELECGTGDGQVSRSIERDGDEPNSKPFMRVQYPTAKGYVDRRYPVADRETGARKRLAAIIAARNERLGIPAGAHNWRCDNGTYDIVQDGDIILQNVAADRAALTSYIQGDPRGAALYIIRPGDVPAGEDVGAYYSRGICVY